MSQVKIFTYTLKSYDLSATALMLNEVSFDYFQCTVSHNLTFDQVD